MLGVDDRSNLRRKKILFSRAARHKIFSCVGVHTCPGQPIHILCAFFRKPYVPTLQLTYTHSPDPAAQICTSVLLYRWKKKGGGDGTTTESCIVWVWTVNAHIAQNDPTHHDAGSADRHKGLTWLLTFTRSDYWAHDCNSTWSGQWFGSNGSGSTVFGTCSRLAPRFSGFLSPPNDILHSVITLLCTR